MDPISLLQSYLAEVKPANQYYNAMTLSTVDPSTLMPRNRVVLLNEITNNEQLEFFTNYDSHKGDELSHNSNACVSFFWPEMYKQVIVQGTIQKTSREISEAYFAGRARDKQLAALVSNQSKVIESHAQLLNDFEQAKKEHQQKIIPCPKHWGGYHLAPSRIEIWEGSECRLHKRHEYLKKNNQWQMQVLAP